MRGDPQLTKVRPPTLPKRVVQQLSRAGEFSPRNGSA